jgi:hypothetical protein
VAATIAPPKNDTLTPNQPKCTSAMMTFTNVAPDRPNERCTSKYVVRRVRTLTTAVRHPIAHRINPASSAASTAFAMPSALAISAPFKNPGSAMLKPVMIIATRQPLTVWWSGTGALA